MMRIFRVGEEVANLLILESPDEGECSLPAYDRRYRVRCFACGHEYVLTRTGLLSRARDFRTGTLALNCVKCRPRDCIGTQKQRKAARNASLPRTVFAPGWGECELLTARGSDWTK